MPGKYGKKLIYQCFHDKNEDDADDNADGYNRLEDTEIDVKNVTDSVDNKDSFTSSNLHAKPTGKGRHRKKREVYADVDVKGRRISSKLRRKEFRKRIGHALHSTWKWVKRGTVAVAPSIASILIISPVPLFAAATSSPGQRQAAKSYK